MSGVTPHDHDHSHHHEHSGEHGHSHHHEHAHAGEETRATLPHGAGAGLTLHLDCFSGIAGDMFVAALLDLGVPREPIDRALEALPLEGFALQIGRAHV